MSHYPPELARADRLLTAEELRQKYESEHSRFLRSHWEADVKTNPTCESYWDWVEAQLEDEE